MPAFIYSLGHGMEPTRFSRRRLSKMERRYRIQDIGLRIRTVLPWRGFSYSILGRRLGARLCSSCGSGGGNLASGSFPSMPARLLFGGDFRWPESAPSQPTLSSITARAAAGFRKCPTSPAKSSWAATSQISTSICWIHIAAVRASPCRKNATTRPLCPR